MRRLVLCVVASLLAHGCSGTRSDELLGSEDPVAPPDAGITPPAAPEPRDPRAVSLEAAGGIARSPNHQLDFRVAAPILVVSNPQRGAAKRRSAP